jgi:hypothetical protein
MPADLDGEQPGEQRLAALDPVPPILVVDAGQRIDAAQPSATNTPVPAMIDSHDVRIDDLAPRAAGHDGPLLEGGNSMR